MRAVAAPPIAGVQDDKTKLQWCIDRILDICRVSRLPDTVAAARQEAWIGARLMTPNGSGASTVDFDATTQSYAHFEWAPPRRWNGGTVSFVPYWTNAGGFPAENVVFSLAGVAISNDDVINTTFGTAQTSNDTWIARGDLHIGPESSSITIGGSPATADLVVFQLSRVVVSDNLTGDARLIGIKLVWTSNSASDDINQ